MFLGLRKLGNICCGHKMFLNKIRKTLFVSRTRNLCPQEMLRARANGETFVSATMCPQHCILVCHCVKFKLINFLRRHNLCKVWTYQRLGNSFIRTILFQLITAPFNNVWTRSTDKCVFATVNQMFADSSQVSTAAERALIKSLCTVQTTNSARQ